MALSNIKKEMLVTNLEIIKDMVSFENVFRGLLVEKRQSYAYGINAEDPRYFFMRLHDMETLPNFVKALRGLADELEKE